MRGNGVVAARDPRAIIAGQRAPGRMKELLSPMYGRPEALLKCVLRVAFARLGCRKCRGEVDLYGNQ
jgi:hypothetical protein